MSDQQKIWFIYLTDHHEGPFTVEEVAGKVAQGLVNGQSLAWKDGMPEWVALETIPDLKAALSGGAAPAPAAPAAGGGAGGEEGFSLAQMLAQQQQSEKSQPSITGTITSAGSVLSSMVSEAQAKADAQAEAAGGYGIPGGSPAFSDANEPSPEEEVWTLRIGDQVSGLHSLNRLKELASEGEIPADAMLWHPGWSDFQPLASIPSVASSRRAKRMMSSGGPSRSGPGGRPAGFAPITAGANVGDDEPTDPGLAARQGTKKGFAAILERITNLMPKKKAKGIATANVAGKTSSGISSKAKAGSSGLVGALRRVAMMALVLTALAGGGAAYYMFFMSPIPSDLDVTAEDHELMVEVAKTSEEDGIRLHLAPAKGTEDNPADPTTPKFYVASNLPEGATVTMKLIGQPGTLVNKISFEKDYTAVVSKKHIATFDQLQDDGKPLAMGMYKMRIVAEGAAPLEIEKFLGGMKGAAYENRLRKFKEKLQGEYDAELAELREFVQTLKTTQTELTKRIAEYKAGSTNPANRSKLVYDWRTNSTTMQNMLTQMEEKLRQRLSNSTKSYNHRAFEDIAKVLTQVQDLFKAHGLRVEGGTPPTNPDEMEGLVQTAVISIDQWLAEASSKSPFEVSKSPASQNAPVTAPASGTPPAEDVANP